MPYRTRRTYYYGLGIVEEAYSSDKPDPCQQCKQPFGPYSRRYRLKELDSGGVLRGFGRVCHCCKDQRIYRRT